MPSAIEQYRHWQSQKSQIVGKLLQELSLAVNAATEMREAFTADEIRRFEEFDQFLLDLQNSYPVGSTPTLPMDAGEVVSSPKGRRPIQRVYTDQTPQCSAHTAKGDRCTFPSMENTTLCSKHTK